jgi:subtilase family serine protease
MGTIFNLARAERTSLGPQRALKTSTRRTRQMRTVSALAAGILATPLGVCDAAPVSYDSDNTPAFVASAKMSGHADSSTRITLGLWLHPRNQAALDALAADLYNPASPRYRQWLTKADVLERFAPTAAQVETVRDFLEKGGLTGISEDPNRFYVRANATIAQAEKIFHVTINDYQVGGRTLRANAGDPVIAGPAGALVQAVSGFDSAVFQQTLKLPPASAGAVLGQAHNPGDLNWAVAHRDAAGFQSACFPGPETKQVNTGGGYPKATYSGNGYYSVAAGCGYTPAKIYAAYNLNPLYRAGFDGKGQTIELIEPCGTPTLQADANTFSKRFGLPALTSANFRIVNYPAPSACSGYNPVINGDVEWAHAIAPGAKILVVVPPSSLPEDVDEATFYATSNGLGSVISGSYYAPEFFTSKAEVQKENLISEIAATMGIATNYASGDYSNYTYAHVPATVSVPADLPFATGVGGVSLALNGDGSVKFQAAWENHISILMSQGTINNPSSPLDFYGFGGGAGGGASKYFAKPGFQKSLAGNFRQVPDIAWLADPLTGGLIVVSQAGQFPSQVWYAYGGTELATPMFSALWAIANQVAGKKLGQAARYLYSMPASTITDIVPLTSARNLTADVAMSASQSHRYDAAQTLAIEPSLFGGFYSVLDVDPTGAVYDLSFGQDYYLHPAKGWDPITGLGTPNGKTFADWFAPKTSEGAP